MSEPGIIKHVRVFIDRATITRQRRVTLQSGLQTVEFCVLPSNLETDTLRAQVHYEGPPIRVLGVSACAAYSEPTSERRGEVQTLLDEVQAKLRAAEDAQNSDEQAVRLLGKYAILATDKLSLDWLDSNPAFDKCNEIFDHLQQSHARLASSHASGADFMTELRQQQAELEDELERLGRRTAIGHRVSVNLQVPEAPPGEVTVELAYVTRAAQWMPAYDARLQSEGGKQEALFTGIALVKQVTGEDWQDVTLVATTARPPLAEPPPELQKLLVAGHQAAPDRDVYASHEAGPRLGGFGGKAKAPAVAQVEHEAPGTVSVPSTSKPVRVELFEALLPAKRHLQVAALQRAVPVWVLDLENTSGRILLPGTVSLFRGPNYSGRAELGFVAGGERFSLPLATEGSLRVTRRTHNKPQQTTLVMGTQIFVYETETQVENTGPEPIEVTVLERVPVSRLEQVTVERKAVPSGAVVDEETGRLSVKIMVPAHAERRLVVGFRISAPRGVSIQPPEQL